MGGFDWILRADIWVITVSGVEGDYAIESKKGDLIKWILLAKRSWACPGFFLWLTLLKGDKVVEIAEIVSNFSLFLDCSGKLNHIISKLWNS